MKDAELSEGLAAKLDVLIRLTALSAIGGLGSLKEKSVLLSKAGLPPKEIAFLCDSTPNAVSVALSNARKEAK